jgi:large-conductance mechanosensitive channel
LAEEKARLEKELNPSAEELLKEIRDLLKQK